MIQIYVSGNKNFDKNGDHVLDATSCYLEREINGTWEVEMECPVSEVKKGITEEAVLKVPTPEGDKLYWIYNVISLSEDTITAFARPIFMNAANEVFLLDARPTNKNGQETLDILTDGTIYSGKSNITKTSTAYYEKKNLLEALNGKEDNAFVKRWGGEVLYNDFEVIINERIGGDYGATAEYGKDLLGVEYEVNTDDMVTRIVPVAYNGYMMSGNTPWVDSEKINNYQKKYIKTIKFDDVKMVEDATSGDEEKEIVVCQDQEELNKALMLKCVEQFKTGIDEPKITMDINMVDLSQTDEYKKFQNIEKIGFGDTITCKHHKMNIQAKARVIHQKWDCILKRNELITIGKYQNDYFDRLSSASTAVEKNLNNNGTINAEKIQGVLDAMYTQLRLQSTIAKKVSGRVFIVEDLDPESPIYGAMVWGTQGMQIATQRTEDGKDWDWTTAVTARGILANVIIAGILTDKTGQNYWNLDTGEFRLSSSAFKVDEVALDAYINGKISELNGLVMNLSNDFQMISTDEDGNYTMFPETKTTATVYFGLRDVSKDCIFEISKTASVTGLWDEQTHSYTVTGLSEDSGHVDIIATYLGNFVSTKRFQIKKLKDGKNGITYSLDIEAEIMKRDSSGTVTPENFNCEAFQIAAGKEKTEISGFFTFEISDNGKEWELVKTSNMTINSYFYASFLHETTKLVKVTFVYDEIPVCIQIIPVLREVDELTHEQVFNLLTLNGTLKGIYKEGNELYISFTYAKGGTLKLGGKSNGNGVLQMLNDSGGEIGKWDNTGLYVYAGEINGVKIIASEGKIGGFDIVNGTLMAVRDDGYQVMVSPGGIRSATENGYVEMFGDRLTFVEASVVTEGEPADGGMVVGEISWEGILGTDGNTVIGFDRNLYGTWYSEGMYFTGDIYSEANMYINGEKDRVVDTKHYGTRCVNAYETATPYFGDIGTDVLDQDGICTVTIEEVFREVVTMKYEYQVFLQKEGPGEIWVDSKESAFFIVKGTPGLKFSWEIKAIQVDRTPEDRLKEFIKPVKGEKK